MKRNTRKKSPSKKALKWKTVDPEDILEDRLVHFKPSEGLKWNTYKTVPDPSRWEETTLKPEDKILDLPDVRNLLAISYADKTSGGVKGHCKISFSGNVPNGVVQIPFQKDGATLSVVTFRPCVKFVVPNNDCHVVQRRLSRWIENSVSQDVANSLLTTPQSMVVGDVRIESEKGGKGTNVVYVREGTQSREKIYP